MHKGPFLSYSAVLLAKDSTAYKTAEVAMQLQYNRNSVELLSTLTISEDNDINDYSSYISFIVLQPTSTGNRTMIDH